MTRIPRWTWARRLTALAFFGLLVWGTRSEDGWLLGSTAATTFFDVVPFLDPLAALESGLASRSVTTTVLLGAGVLIGLTLLLGPVFCGWLCPLGLLFDLAYALRSRVLRLVRGKGRRAPIPRPLPPRVRLLILGALLGVGLVAALPLFQAVSPIHLLVRGVIFGASAGLIVVLALVVLELVFPRIWCRSLCPLGGLYSLLGRVAPFRVRIDPELAGQTPCRMCTIHCPMGIRVMEDYSLAGRPAVDDPLCTRCGSCLDACPRTVLGLGFRRAAKKEPSR